MRVRSAKRSDVERTGVHAWMPYYAGFSEASVGDLVSEFSSKGDVVLDPMNGSGTTTLVAQRLGRKAIGCDVSPVALTLAQAKTRSARLSEHALGRLVARLDRLSRWKTVRSIPRLNSPWLAEMVYRCCRSVFVGGEHPIARAAALVAVRQLCPPGTSSNPTWLVPPASLPVLTAKQCAYVLRREARRLTRDLRSTKLGTGSAEFVRASAAALPLPNKSVDFVITSPPYMTRLDYVRATYPELLVSLASADAVEELRRLMLGAPLVSHQPGAIRALPAIARRVYRRIRNHESRSARYYSHWAADYLKTAMTVTQELVRVTRRGGHVALIVQDSWVKDVEVRLGEIYSEMLESAGAKVVHEIEQPVIRSFASLNTSARAYEKGSVSEWVIVARV